MDEPETKNLIEQALDLTHEFDAIMSRWLSEEMTRRVKAEDARDALTAEVARLRAYADILRGDLAVAIDIFHESRSVSSWHSSRDGDVDELLGIYWPVTPEMEELHKMPRRGTCRVCGCTHTTPCVTEGRPCAWTDETETLCTACAEKGTSHE